MSGGTALMASQRQSATPDYTIEAVPDRIAILASGGLDSSVMLGWIARSGRRVFPLYIRAGLAWEVDELRTLKRFVRALAMDNVEAVTPLKMPMGDLAHHLPLPCISDRNKFTIRDLLLESSS